jgi:hypothetical protein
MRKVSLLPGSLVRIDATTGRILARVAIPFPKLLAADGRSVWVLSDEGAREKLVHVDAVTNAVTAIFNADGFALPDQLAVAPTQLAVAGGSAWLGNEWGPVYRFAPGASAGEAAEIEFESSGFVFPVAAAGSLWVRGGEGDGGLLRVDPATGRILAELAPVDRVVASGTGFLWALDWKPDGDALVHIDMQTHATEPIGVLAFPWADLTLADGAVWASNPQDGTIVRLDSVTGEEQERIPVGREPGALAAGGGAVWAGISNGTVVRYDIATDRIERIDVGGTPNDLVFAHGAVWVVVDELSGSVNRLTRAEYIAQAVVICGKASARFHAAVGELEERDLALKDIAAWNAAAARFSEEALVELRALTPPEADRAHLNEFYWLLEQQTDVLRRTAMAASNLDHVRPEDLIEERVDLTHQKDALEPDLQGCPVSLPA